MASFSKVNGDFKQVMNLDTPSYTNSGLNDTTDGAAVQPQGPKLDFFTVTKDTGAFTAANVATLVQTIQQLATIYIYQYTNDTDDTFAVAVYPAGAWTTTSLDTAITDAGVAVTVAASATFAN